MTEPRTPPDFSGKVESQPRLPTVEGDPRVRRACSERDRLRVKRDSAEAVWEGAVERAREVRRQARTADVNADDIRAAIGERREKAARLKAAVQAHDTAILHAGKVRRVVEGEVLQVAGEAYDRLLDDLAEGFAALADAWEQRSEALTEATRAALGPTSAWRRFPRPADHPRRGSAFHRLYEWAKERRP